MKRLALASIGLATLWLAPPAVAADALSSPQAAKRTILHRQDVPNSSYEVVVPLVEVPPHTKVGRHTHPGTVLGYVIEGDYTIAIEGQPPSALEPGQTQEIPAGAVHDEYSSSQPAKLIAVFTVEKGKPLVTPAP